MPNLWAINMHASKIRTLPPTGHDCAASPSHVYAGRAQEVDTRAALDRLHVDAAEETRVAASGPSELYFSSFSASAKLSREKLCLVRVPMDRGG